MNESKASQTDTAPLRLIDEGVSNNPKKLEAELRALLAEDPLNAEAYRTLATLITESAARQSNDGFISSDASDRGIHLARAARALQANDLPTAEVILRARLLAQPADVDGLRLLAELATKLGFDEQSAELLRYAMELSPAVMTIKLDLAQRYFQMNRIDESLTLINEVLAVDPNDVSTLYSKAVALGHAGRFEEMVAIYEQLVVRAPDWAKLWVNYGRSLKTVGRSKEGIAALRRALEIDCYSGEAWWSLSDLKTVRFVKDEIALMESALCREKLSQKDRCYLHFALGKAFEDQKDFSASFEQYSKGNWIRRQEVHHDAEQFAAYVSRARQIFDEKFFTDRKDWGSLSSDPVFILGMTRAGSTLIEQILASHSMVEGTMELPTMLAVAKDICSDFDGRVEAVAALSREEARERGEQYIRETQAFRKLQRPFFIDKMPSNWLNIPLIQLVLPKARIIDARRHPLACCFSNFKQNYARGQAFSYDLRDVGHFYANYVRMMAHVDAVLPGKVYRVFHERLLEDPEREIRALLDFLGLPFEHACLHFHKTERAVRTASAEQVRQPINLRGADQWRPFELWLTPLKESLGSVLTHYPEVPSFG